MIAGSLHVEVEVFIFQSALVVNYNDIVYLQERVSETLEIYY